MSAGAFLAPRVDSFPTCFLSVTTMQPHFLLSTLALALALALGATPLRALAHEGHDEAPAAVAGAALPRFAATSERFELVGVLDGQKLALYLDHAGDNSPVKEAQLELDIAGTRVPVSRVADGEFTAELAAPLAEGETPVTATVMAGSETDLLAGEIDVHGAAPAQGAHGEHAHPAWRTGAALGGAAAAVLLVLAAVWRLRRRGRAVRAARTGGAA